MNEQQEESKDGELKSEPESGSEPQPDIPTEADLDALEVELNQIDHVLSES